jgi:trimeric autotransporter adhesin
VSGAGFTSNSVVRWNGAARPTAFVSGSRLTATISFADVSAVADIPVTVYDPSPVPTGTQTLPLIFHVVQSVSRVYLPVVFK